MCYLIKIDKERKMAQIKARGSVDILELRRILLETFDHDDWQAGFNMLCDYSEIEKFEVTSEDIDAINDWQTSIDEVIGDGRCAVVAGPVHWVRIGKGERQMRHGASNR